MQLFPWAFSLKQCNTLAPQSGCGELRDYVGRDAGRIASAIASVLCYRIGYSVFNNNKKRNYEKQDMNN